MQSLAIWRAQVSGLPFIGTGFWGGGGGRFHVPHEGLLFSLRPFTHMLAVLAHPVHMLWRAYLVNNHRDPFNQPVAVNLEEVDEVRSFPLPWSALHADASVPHATFLTPFKILSLYQAVFADFADKQVRTMAFALQQLVRLKENGNVDLKIVDGSGWRDAAALRQSVEYLSDTPVRPADAATLAVFEGKFQLFSSSFLVGHNFVTSSWIRSELIAPGTWRQHPRP